jgi:two-component system invasion response regulator UvrY
MIKIFVVDDHPVVRQGLKRILSSSGKIEVSGEAGSIPDLYDLLKTEAPPQALVLDLSLPGKSGFEALSQIKYDYPKLPILILSIHPEAQYALRALKAGASGYLSKECAPEQLIQAIQTIVANETYITPIVASLLTEHLKSDQSGQPLQESLSNREYQVLLQIGKGVPLTDVAKQFNVSVKTISTYRVRILTKMNMKTNAELISFVIKNELDA